MQSAGSGQEAETFNDCVYFTAIDDVLIEVTETVSVMIDRESLMTNDMVGEPSEVEVRIADNDGMFPCNGRGVSCNELTIEVCRLI